MLNPRDVELLEDEEGRKLLPPEFVEEFSDCKGDDEDGSDAEIHK